MGDGILKAEAPTEADIAKRLVAYARTYTARHLVQEADDALGDPQLGSITGHLVEALSATEAGRIYDIGAGRGTLLARLAKLDAFASRPGWRYCAVDFEEELDSVHRVARELRLTARTDELTIEQFASEPPSDARIILFCRNVLHELKIGEVTDLLHNAIRLLGPDDTLLIQDLVRFPEGEQNHHCWTSRELRDTLVEIGFSPPLVYEQGTQKGNGWLNLRTRWTGAPLPDRKAIRQAVLAGRQRQWALWSALETAGGELPERDELIQALDLDLQLASLTKELRAEGGIELKLDPAVERRIRLNEINKRIEALAEHGLKSADPPPPHPHFRERGAQLTQAETFLRSPARLAIIHGGVGTGKTAFLDQLLATRLYDKALVRLDARVARGVWPMVEGAIAQLGVNLAVEAISVLGDLAYEQIVPAMGRLLNAVAPRLVLVVENLDEVLDSNQRFIDPQIEAFLAQVVGKNGAKVIVSSRREYLPRSLLKAAGSHPLTSVRMGRFATVETVTNVLDDFFDRGRAGLPEYPAGLIDAIDRHPLVAKLAGQILEAEGSGVLVDETFIRQVRNRLYADLIARLVEEPSEAAMLVASELRVAVPAGVLEALAGRDSVHSARENDVIYAVHDRRWGELLASIGLFRKRSGTDLMPASARDVEDAAGVNHACIAEQLERTYRQDDDPKWIRESYYHRMLAGQTEGLSLSAYAGSYYRTELVASAGYCFERGDYGTALKLYDAALTLGALDETALMRRASSMVREGDDAGSEEYLRLVADYPANMGMRRSHVDALLWVNKPGRARAALRDYGLAPEADPWHALQWGRAELGLHNYPRAIELFTALKDKRPDDPFVVTYLARALQQFGDLDGAIMTLEAGAIDFPDNDAILTSLAQNLERARRDDEAKPLLAKLLEDDAGNARAALSLVRILLREGDRPGADRAARRSARQASGRMRTFAFMAQAEVMVADGQPDAAAEFLRDHVGEDDDVGTLIIDALLRAAERETDPISRAAFIRKASEVRVKPSMTHNVPVQVVLVRLSVAAKNRAAFDTAIGNLAQTRIQTAELERLRALW